MDQKTEEEIEPTKVTEGRKEINFFWTNTAPWCVVVVIIAVLMSMVIYRSYSADEFKACLEHVGKIPRHYSQGNKPSQPSQPISPEICRKVVP